MSARFTIDGSDALEQHLTGVCQQVLAGVQKIVPNLEALVLGGGYGRGQGGVLKTAAGDRPYNDLEFYVFTRGNVLLDERRLRGPLHELGEQLSPAAGLHVEFKVYSKAKLRRTAISMFTYDLLAGHQIIWGGESVFAGCDHHAKAERIPVHEAARLMFNRCSGLLLAADYLRAENLAPDQADFIGRNLAKAQLAFGDAILGAFGLYHWDCRERDERLNKLQSSKAPPWRGDVLKFHAAGVEFKLHPRVTTTAKAELARQHAEVSALGRQIWLWLESRRLNQSFPSVRDYALSPVSKCPETSAWRNALVNFRTFGRGGIRGPGAFRYPRERLFHALCLLLWDERALEDSATRNQLQAALQTQDVSWAGLIAAYQRIWQNFG